MNKQKKSEKKRIAVVRVRGNVHVRQDIEDTMNSLNLTRANHCTVIENTEEYMGMIKKVNNHVTWGEINESTMEKLLVKKGKTRGDGKITNDYVKKNTDSKSIKDFTKKFMSFKSKLRDIPEIKAVFRLKPPSKGYERGGIKRSFSRGGALGYRGDKINELLERMI